MKQGIPEKKFCSNKRRQLQYSMAKKWPAIDSHKKAQQPQSIVFFWSTLKGAGWFDKQSGLPNPKLCRWLPDCVVREDQQTGVHWIILSTPAIGCE